MTKEEILKILRELQKDFAPDYCIDWAQDAIDAIDRIIEDEDDDRKKVLQLW